MQGRGALFPDGKKPVGLRAARLHPFARTLEFLIFLIIRWHFPGERIIRNERLINNTVS
jgi:hypothetical protein